MSLQDDNGSMTLITWSLKIYSLNRVGPGMDSLTRNAI